jgi:hypothetical protein
LPRPGATWKIGPWAGGVGYARQKRKNKDFSFICQKKKIDQRFRRPHGIGFPTVISTAFSQGKGSAMTIEGEHFVFFCQFVDFKMIRCLFEKLVIFLGVDFFIHFPFGIIDSLLDLKLEKKKAAFQNSSTDKQGLVK